MEEKKLLWSETVDQEKKAVQHFVLMAKKGYHKMINYDEPHYDIASITHESGYFWIGHWVTGFGFVDIQFPKAETRKLTDDEWNALKNSQFGVNFPMFKLTREEETGIVRLISILS